MRKGYLIALSCIMAMSLMAGSAFAKPGNGNGNGNGNGAGKKVESTSNSKGNASDKGETGGKVNVNSKEDKAANKVKEKEVKATVTSDTYKKGPNGYKGLLKAIENVKDKPAGAVLANLLLTKYETKLTDEMKAELEGILEKDKALTKAAEMLEEGGSVTDAVYVQKEAILANVQNLDSYKKLGKLYDKLGKKGINLFVNGEEVAANTAPVVENGRTLVPFRSISESLQAEVVWNSKERSVTVTKDGVTVKLVINSKTALVGGKKHTLDTPAKIINGSTVVPVRFISESLDSTVKWEPESQSVVVYEE